MALTNATGDPDGVILGEMNGVWEEDDVGDVLGETDGIIERYDVGVALDMIVGELGAVLAIALGERDGTVEIDEDGLELDAIVEVGADFSIKSTVNLE